MQVAANQQLAKNRRNLGTAFHLGALAIFAVGLVISLNTDPTRDVPWFSWLSIVLGMALYAVGQTQLRRWGSGLLQAERVSHAMRGLDDRYKLYTFLSSDLPDFLLVGPHGVSALVPRHEGGTIVCERDRWKKTGRPFILAAFDTPLGNPSREAVQQANRLRKVLDAVGFGDVPANGVVVFTNPKVTLKVEGSSAVVTRIKELKDVLRRLAGKGQQVALPAGRVRDVQSVFDQRVARARAWR